MRFPNKALWSKQQVLTEEVGFEPTEHCCSEVFKTSTLNHSDTLPKGRSGGTKGRKLHFNFCVSCCENDSEYSTLFFLCQMLKILPKFNTNATYMIKNTIPNNLKLLLRSLSTFLSVVLSKQ